MPTSRRGRRRRTWPQRLLIGFNIFLIFVCLVAAAGLGYFHLKFAQLPRIELGNVLAEEDGPTAPQNFLLVGVDSAEGIDPNDPITIGRAELGAVRSDTIMVLRLEPGSSEAHLLSILRDLWVPIACTGNEQRINTALEEGGAQCLVETLEAALDLPIHHYVQVDWLGFQRLVDAVDGVPIFFPNPVRDRNSGLLVDTPGCVTLDSTQALAFARSRYYENFVEGQWEREGSADRGRVQRQQLFIRQALRRAVAKGVRNPIVLNELVDVGLESVVLDDRLSARDIFQLGNRFRSFDPESLRTYTLPTADEVTAAGASIQLLLPDQAQPILDVFRGRAPDAAAEDLAPGDVRARVLNGSGVTGQAAEAAQALAAAGFDVGPTADAEAVGGPTVVRFAAGRQAEADLVRRWLVSGAQLEESADVTDADVVVVTGTDWAGVRAEPAPPEDGATTTTTATTAPPSSTTTATSVPPEVVPQPPPDAAPCG